MTDPIDPRAFRWVEAGVSGLARSRDWDTVELVALPELAEHPLEEFRFGALADGTLVIDGDGVDEVVAERLGRRLSETLDGPYEAVAARQTRLDWSVAARVLRIEELTLPALESGEIVVALGPDGETTVVVDGVEPDGASDDLAFAVELLLELGSRRFPSFVVRARRTVGDRWGISVDPL